MLGVARGAPADSAPQPLEDAHSLHLIPLIRDRQVEQRLVHTDIQVCANVRVCRVTELVVEGCACMIHQLARRVRKHARLCPPRGADAAGALTSRRAPRRASVSVRTEGVVKECWRRGYGHGFGLGHGCISRRQVRTPSRGRRRLRTPLTDPRGHCPCTFTPNASARTPKRQRQRPVS